MDIAWDPKYSSKEAKLRGLTLKNIEGVIVKDIRFDHSSFPTTGSESYKRLKLTHLTINGETHDFEYEDSDFPPLDSFNKDHWGFYNGARNTSAIPRFEYALNKYIGDNANRMPNGRAMQLGILKKITYPTGGYTQFEFEPNTYFNFDGTVTIEQAWTYRLDMKEEYGHSKYQDFSWPHPVLFPLESGIDYEEISWKAKEALITFGTKDNGHDQPEEYTDGSPYAKLGGNFYSLGTGAGGNYDPRTGYWYNREHIEINEDNYNNLKEFNIRLKTGTVPGNFVSVRVVADGTFQHPYPLVGDGHILIGGLRVKAIKSYDHNGKFIEGKAYKYKKHDLRQEHEISSGVLLYGSSEGYASNALMYLDQYAINRGCWNQDKNRFNVERLIMTDSPNGGRENGPTIMYRNVKELEINPSFTDSAFLGSVVSTFEIIPDPTVSLHYPYPSRILDSWNRGQLNGRKHYAWDPAAEQEKLLREEIYYYSSSYSSFERGAKFVKSRSYIWDFSHVSDYNMDAWGNRIAIKPCTDTYDYNPHSEDQFSYVLYSYTSAYKHLDSATFIDYRRDVPLTIKKYYDYNLEYQQLQAERIVTPEKTIRKEITYPFNFSNGSTAQEYANISYFMIRNAIIYPIEERTYLESPSGDQLIYAKFTQYTGVSPAKVYSYKVPEPVTDFQKAENMQGMDERYDSLPDLRVTHSNSQIVEQIGLAGIPTSYIWSYQNQYVVLKIENVGIAEINRTVPEASQLLSNPAPLPEEVKSVRNAIQGAFPAARISSYLYKPLVGMSSVIDPNGKVTEYFYDGQNRLKSIKEDGELVQTFDYNVLNSKGIINKDISSGF